MNDPQAALIAQQRFKERQIQALSKPVEEFKETIKVSKEIATSFKDLESKLKELGASDKEIARIKTALRQANPDMFKQQIAEAAEEMRKLGATEAEIAKVTEGLEKSAGAGKRLSLQTLMANESYKKLADGMVSVITKSVETAAAFEQSMARVQAVSGASGEEMERMRQSAISLGATTAYSASEAATGMGLLAEAGYSTEDILTAIPGVMTLAAAGQMDLANAADVTTSLLRDFGLTAGDTGRLVDVLAKASQDSNGTVADFGAALAAVAPMASGMGVSLEETTAALAALGDAGLTGGAAGGQLKEMLETLSSPSAEAAAKLQELGVSVKDSTGHLLPLGEIIGQLETSFYGLSEAQQSEAASMLVGKNAAAGLLTLIENGSGTFDAYTQSLQNAGGTAAGMASTQMDTFKGAVESLKSALEGAGIIIGDALLPAIRMVAEFLTGLISIFNNMDPALRNAIITFGLVATAILTIGSTITTLSAAMKVLGIAINTSFPLIGAISLVIGGLTAAVAYFSKKSHDAAEAVKEHEAAQQALNEVLGKSPMSRTVEDLEELRKKSAELAPVLAEQKRLQDELNEIEAAGKSGDFFTTAMYADAFKAREELEKVNKEISSMGYDNVAEATVKYQEMTDAIQASANALMDERKAELDTLIARKNKNETMADTLALYKTLTESGKEDAATTARINEAVKALKQEYPDLQFSMDANNRARIDNIDLVGTQIQAEKDLMRQAIVTENQFLQSQQSMLKAQYDSVSKQISNYIKLAEAMELTSGAKPGTFGALAAQEKPKSPYGLDFGSGAAFFQPLSKALIDADKAKAEQELVKVNDAWKENGRKMDSLKGLLKVLDKSASGGLADGPGSKETETGGGPGAKGSYSRNDSKTPAQLKEEERKKNYDSALSTANFEAELKDWSAGEKLAAYQKISKDHKQHLSESLDDSRTMQLQIKRLEEDSLRSNYAFSTDFIANDQKRMEKAGKTEREMANQRLYLWGNVRKKYKADTEQYKAADEEMRKARQDIAQAVNKEQQQSFDKQVKRLEHEMDALKDSGKTEAEIAAYKLAKWTELRDTYTGNAALYKKADDEIYSSRRKLTETLRKEAEDMVTKQKAAIAEEKKAALDAIEHRRKANADAIDDQIRDLQKLRDAHKTANVDADYETQLAEKNARIAELGSAVGPEGIAEREQAIKERDRMVLEHERDLADRSLEAQQQALQEQKNLNDLAAQQEKDAVTASYDALLQVFEGFKGDVTTLQAAINAFRITDTGAANAQILTELDAFVVSYNQKLLNMRAMEIAADEAEYKANGVAWNKAKAAGDQAMMDYTHERNQALRDKYGNKTDTGYLQTMRDGGVVQGVSGQPVQIQAHAGEMVFNPGQQAVLFRLLTQPLASLGSLQPVTSATTINQHFDLSMDKVEIADKMTAESVYIERERMARRLAAAGVKA
jgi:TP901 family phage tail tape measure protein